MKIRTEICDCEEIVIRCRARNDQIYAIENAIEEALRKENSIALTLGNTECFLKKSEILYFESTDGKVYAHTVDRIYTAHYKLFELEERLPPYFVRISKSAIANVTKIATLRRELVGNGELTFAGCQKSVWFSRSYYQLLRHKLEEMR